MVTTDQRDDDTDMSETQTAALLRLRAMRSTTCARCSVSVSPLPSAMRRRTALGFFLALACTGISALALRRPAPPLPPFFFFLNTPAPPEFPPFPLPAPLPI